MFDNFRNIRRAQESALAQQLQFSTFREFKIAEIKTATKNFSERELLGKGSFAEVYRGTTPDGCSFAFKRLKTPAEEGSQAYILLERELKAFSRLSHNHIIRLHGYCLTSKDHVLVYELADGGTLEDLLLGSDGQGCSLPLKQRLELALDMAEALSYLHSQGVIHRDIKPANILLNSTCQAKLADFGLLKLLDPKHEDTITKLAGTLGYMDPESVRTGRVSFASDVYAFGVILLSLLTGRGPAVTDPEDLDFARKVEEHEKGGGGPQQTMFNPLKKERSYEAQKLKGRNMMALRRWVGILSKGGQIKALLDPALWPLLQLQGTAGGPWAKPGSGDTAAGGFQRHRHRVRSQASPRSDGGKPIEERQRKEILALKSSIALAMQCSAELPKGRPPMGSVCEDLKMMLRNVSSKISSDEYQTFTLTDINVLTRDRTFPLDGKAPSSLFCGKDVWDGEPCIVEQRRYSSAPPGLTKDDILLHAKIAFEEKHPFVLPVSGSSTTDAEVYIVYGMPRDADHGLASLEYILFQTGCDFESFTGRKLCRPSLAGPGSLPGSVSQVGGSTTSSSRKGASLFGAGPQDLTGFTVKPEGEGKGAGPAQDLPLLLRCSLALCVAQALQFLHSAGFVFGDVSPSRILVDGSGNAYLVGYGQAIQGNAKRTSADLGSCKNGLERLHGTQSGNTEVQSLSSDFQSSLGTPEDQGTQWPGDGDMDSVSDEECEKVHSFPEGSVDIESFGEFLLELGTGRGPTIHGDMDLAIVGDHRMATIEESDKMSLQEWVAALLDKGKTHVLVPSVASSFSTTGSGLPGTPSAHQTGKFLHSAPIQPPSSSGSSDSTLKVLQHGVESLLNLGLQCLRRDPTLRPPLAEIIARLKALKRSLESGNPSAGSSSVSKVKARPSLQRQPAKKR